MTRLIAASAAVLATLISTAGVAVAAARPPTEQERRALIRAMPASVKRLPARCVAFDFRLDKSGRYASGGPFFPTAVGDKDCLKYAANYGFILYALPRWHVIFAGTDVPPCRLHVPREISGGCLGDLSTSTHRAGQRLCARHGVCCSATGALGSSQAPLACEVGAV